MRLSPFHVHADVLMILGGVWAWYGLTVRRHRSSHPDDRVSRRKVVLFSLGMATLLVGSSWPIHDLAERYLYSVHMVQHMLYSLVAPPLLIAGMPVWLLRRILAPRPVAAAFRVLSRPLVALVVFNAALLFTHWPAVVESSVRSQHLHFSLHVLLVGSALLMWWPVMSPLPEYPPLPLPGQMLYVFLQSLAPTIPASFLTFGHSPLYPVYATFPRIWGISALTDQLLAGLIMKLVGGAILWVVIATVFFRWHAKEERDGLDPLKYRDVERDVRLELTKR